ncbi:phosphoglycerate mutase-like protein 1 [Coffea eugenioides]|uniref:Phosphoglycerate mutase-like protein 1 n=1 Tax=Coffea arabica TaxID=13443 RepID=A0A6P6WDP3_COFAR|nr:phosphoglycerate mutase-like protein 1 [Coffea arabica]XP_027112747.1 phosphoglycerate mutase-like protein 1 [Coffea arabica]XP_027112748.1 phosphoglycerate mutase-like protein 1 [Coffea arabica]XP_027162581.1 phosphoglycerate mutase-like protein 1 [Coffea eugenioides]XP_027162582.1 phosphoglycerate mutase-like protein 1 [Coffea eugenioides]
MTVAASATSICITNNKATTIAIGGVGEDSRLVSSSLSASSASFSSSSTSSFRFGLSSSIPSTPLLTIPTCAASRLHLLRLPPPRRCFASMDSGEFPSLYPLHRCKTIYLVRHAQGIHNVEGDKNYKAYMSPEYFDAYLTPLGWQQVDNLRKHVHTSGLLNRIELVVTSPLLRTMQTAVGVFGGDGYTDRMDTLPLMLANAGNSRRAAISSLNCPPIVALELCREHLGVHPCDKRRSISEYQCLFPAIDFSLIASDEDTLWKANVRETKEEVAARGMNFMKWLLSRKEKEIAVVTHSGFLFHTLSAFGNDCHCSVKKEIAQHFANCELRSMVLVDKSMIGSDSSPINYPGKIPSGLDLPSDLADEKNLENGKT